MKFIMHTPNVAAIRKKQHLSQQKFADRYGLSVWTVRDWEQKKRKPDRAASVLLSVIEQSPDVVIKVLEQNNKIEFPESNYKDFVIELANKYDVQYKETKLDRFANKITELSDDDIEEDSIQLLIRELGRRNILSSKESLNLLYKYLKEKNSV